MAAGNDIGVVRIEPINDHVRLTLGSGGTVELTPAQALRTAFAMISATRIALGYGPDEAIGIRSFKARIDYEVAEDMAATLVIEHADAALAFPFGATQFAEFAADTAEVSRRIG